MLWLAGLALIPLPASAAGRVLSVDPGASLEAVLAAAADGDTVVVKGGRHAGNFTVTKSIRLLGEGGPVLDGGDTGTVLRILAANVEVRGLQIRGSGHSLDQENAGIYVERPGAIIAENQLADVLFGIYLKGSPGTRLEGNRVTGMAIAEGLRGDGIRLWNSPDSQVLGNEVFRTRQVIIQHSDRTRFQANRVEDGVIGLHLMTTHGVEVIKNTIRRCDVGMYAMYGSAVHLLGNLVEQSRGPSGYGLGLKDMDDITVAENQFIGNRAGVYLDNSPRVGGDARNLFRQNLLLGNDRALLLQPGVTGNTFTRNSFTANVQQIQYLGGGDPALNRFSSDGAGNYWSDYAGYDEDGDGVGDLPHRPRSLFETLVDRSPAVAWFLATPAVSATEMAARIYPPLAGPPRVSDDAPLVRSPLMGDPIARRSPGRALLMPILLLGMAGALAAAGLRRKVRA